MFQSRFLEKTASCPLDALFASLRMLWQLGCAALCLLLCVPIGRGLLAVRALERRALLQPQSFNLGRGFHRPLYGATWLLLLLRAAFFALTAMNNMEKMENPVKVATFWLLDMPSVALAVLNGYIVLFAVRLVFRRRWPGATSSGDNGIISAIFVAFCLSLVALVTLVAVGRAERDARGLIVPQWMTFGYTAVIWTPLGLLMLKYWGKAVRLLWRYRRRHQWSALDGEEASKKSSSRLPVLGISCLKNVAMCSTLLAELLIVRGVLCAIAASQSETEVVDLTSWRSVIMHYFGWEVANVAIVLRMLHQTPIAVHYCSDEFRNTMTVPKEDTGVPSAPDFDGGEVQIQFEVPHVRELVADFVVPSNASLLFARRRGMEHENAVEDRYCRVHTGASSVGAEYVDCRCCLDAIDDQFLNNANVPLLAEEHGVLDDEEVSI